MLNVLLLLYVPLLERKQQVPLKSISAKENAVSQQTQKKKKRQVQWIGKSQTNRQTDKPENASEKLHQVST